MAFKYPSYTQDGGGYKYHSVVSGEQVDRQCAWKKGTTERCEKFGHLGTGTTGHPPFFCGDHFWYVLRGDNSNFTDQEKNEHKEKMRSLFASLKMR